MSILVLSIILILHLCLFYRLTFCILCYKSYIITFSDKNILAATIFVISLISTSIIVSVMHIH